MSPLLGRKLPPDTSTHICGKNRFPPAIPAVRYVSRNRKKFAGPRSGSGRRTHPYRNRRNVQAVGGGVTKLTTPVQQFTFQFRPHTVAAASSCRLQVLTNQILFANTGGIFQHIWLPSTNNGYTTASQRTKRSITLPYVDSPVQPNLPPFSAKLGESPNKAYGRLLATFSLGRPRKTTPQHPAYFPETCGILLTLRSPPLRASKSSWARRAFSKGIIDTKDVVYYLSLTFLGLFLANRSLESLKSPMEVKKAKLV